eukprot:10830350-Ditylum_brightwellii.AAC.1
MRITKEFSREATQLVATKMPPVAFEIEEGVEDRKMRESRMYKLHIQPEEDNSLMWSLTMKQVLRGQNVGNMDAAYTLVQELLRGNTLIVSNNKQAMFEEHI